MHSFIVQRKKRWNVICKSVSNLTEQQQSLPKGFSAERFSAKYFHNC